LLPAGDYYLMVDGKVRRAFTLEEGETEDITIDP